MVDRFIRHLSPAWQSKANAVVLADVDFYDDTWWREQLWARQIEPQRFELCCIPFRTYGMALGDIVATDPDGLVTDVLESSGRLVIRVIIDHGPQLVGTREELLAHTRQAGLLVEWQSERHVAIDSPSTEPLAPLWALLDGLATEKTIYWEYGHGEPSPDAGDP